MICFICSTFTVVFPYNNTAPEHRPSFQNHKEKGCSRVVIFTLVLILRRLTAKIFRSYLLTWLMCDEIKDKTTFLRTSRSNIFLVRAKLTTCKKHFIARSGNKGLILLITLFSLKHQLQKLLPQIHYHFSFLNSTVLVYAFRDLHKTSALNQKRQSGIFTNASILYVMYFELQRFKFKCKQILLIVTSSSRDHKLMWSAHFPSGAS